MRNHCVLLDNLKGGWLVVGIQQVLIRVHAGDGVVLGRFCAFTGDARSAAVVDMDVGHDLDRL